MSVNNKGWVPLEELKGFEPSALLQPMLKDSIEVFQLKVVCFINSSEWFINSSDWSPSWWHRGHLKRPMQYLRYDCMILVYIYILVWHTKTTWCMTMYGMKSYGRGGPETFKNHPQPHLQGTGRNWNLPTCLKMSPSKNDDFLKLYGVPKLMIFQMIEGKTHSGSLWSSGFFSTSVGKGKPIVEFQSCRRIAHRENLK